MTYEITGTVEAIQNIEEFSSGFKKQTIVISDGQDRYPQSIPIEFTKKNLTQLNGVSRKDKVKIKFRLRGREWNGKYYSNIEGFHLQVIESSAPTGNNHSVDENDYDATEMDDEDIPF